MGRATFREFAHRLARRETASRLGLDVDPYVVARLSPPDTVAARQAEDLSRAASSESLANHCFRSYAWGVLLGVADGFSYDAELFYVAAMLHDLGLTEAFDRGGCFEDDGAQAARELLARLGWHEHRTAVVAEAIRLHMHEPGDDASAEALLLIFGTSADVSGRRADEIEPGAREAVLRLFPRLGFKRHFSALFIDQAARKPGCVVHSYVHELRGVDRIMAAPYDD